MIMSQYGQGVRYVYMSESDVYRRQILTSKVDPRAVGINNENVS